MPGVVETFDWASALVVLDAVALDPVIVSDTLGALQTLTCTRDFGVYAEVLNGGTIRPGDMGELVP